MSKDTKVTLSRVNIYLTQQHKGSRIIDSHCAHVKDY